MNTSCREPVHGTLARVALSCGGCLHFVDAPRDIERSLPGMPALGSGYGSVRSRDGVCRLHDRYLSAASRCAQHAPRDD